MTMAGKKLQDIYDSGAQTLADIEEQSIESIKNTKSEHSEKHKRSATQSIEQLEKKSELLQIELKQSINESLKKLQDTMVTENAQSEAFLSSLMVELKTLTEQMKVKLKALKQSHHENVDFARTVAAEQYLNNAEEVSFELEQSLSRSLHKLQLKGKNTINNLQLSLENTLTNLQDEVSEITQTSIAFSKKQASTIADYSSSFLEAAAKQCKDRLTKLEESAQQANQEVQRSSDSLLEEIANHATTIERDISESYEKLTTSHFQNADNRLSNFADELSTLHDATTEQLVSLTEELSEDLLRKSNQVQDGLRNRCSDVVNRMNILFDSFEDKLNQRLEFSRGQKSSLETDKNRILNAVLNELPSIHKSFAKKVAAMLDQSKLELNDLTKAVEAKIIGATETLSEQMNGGASSIQKQIEDEVTRFLQELAIARAAATEEISSAAKGNPASLKTSQVDTNSSADPENSFNLEENSWQTDSQSAVDILESEGQGATETKPRRNRRRKDNKE